ncbi:MAG: hypothetical protein OZSIB_0171 [Candidatus Ozemobacter sibiricus]|uniref:Peptidase S9 prolyl oligopeptidase catalytic domain-containing protein n=1 Tax=Candidatus Ozemobacter sibiricus TaxID=2268124 RepID=A0A367ZMM9_9BACT|nr:MAG: hypothetical protein OZSIB_0171 [Candidatus Ozemobacter sibiricus]
MIVLGLFLTWSLPGGAAGPGEWGAWEQHPLLRQAIRQAAERVAYARQAGARLVPVENGRTFCLVWYPQGAATGARPPVIATLSGHGSWAFDEFFLWHREAAARGYGILALQWWLGTGERRQDYLSPPEVYRSFEQIMRAEGIPPGRNLLHGFSRGSANIYGVTALDQRTGHRFFCLTVANAGKASPDFPINRDLTAGRFGPRPFDQTHWVLYAGAHDPHPERDGIPGMRETAAWLTSLGGTVDLFIEDQEGDHGGFHRRPANLRAALDVFQRLLEEAEAPAPLRRSN